MTGPLGPASLTTDVEPLPAQAEAVFGERLPQAVGYVDLLATAGVERGLIGPRERPRLWSRHVLNSAAVAPALPSTDGPLEVVDIGSGAGLPGIPLALARPDLQMTLLEPLARRVVFLDETVAALGLSIKVIRGRAEEIAEPRWDVAVARAVAPLERLVVLASRLVRPGGTLLAVKGRTVAAEVAAAASVIRRRSTRPAEVLTFGDDASGATVVRVLLDRPRPRGRVS
ncbi:MAG: rRNA (guanine527-N7)-methyltransferase [Frankiaceae bacterium]|nr:rRNA (guanine527-N7)-methyltransferase [Frankiaceae bacterium]